VSLLDSTPIRDAGLIIISCYITTKLQQLWHAAAKCDDLDYINFLLASVDVFTCTEAARCYIDEDNSPSHDAFTRLLRRQPPDTKGLWSEVKDV
jgi:hypothetical protein